MHSFKTAILGTGFVGRLHLEALHRLGNVQVEAIAEADSVKAKRLAEQFNVARVESDYHRLLQDPAIQVVHICTPNYLHYSMAKAALEAGKHVVCEKPLATSVIEGRELVQLARET